MDHFTAHITPAGGLTTDAATLAPDTIRPRQGSCRRSSRLAMLAAALLLAATVPAAAAFEAEGLPIGEIIIDNANIFNLEDSQENKALFRAANLLHLRTRQKVIRRQLLFRPGDPYSQRLAEESERILRSNKYLENARIEPVQRPDGKVDVHVRTTDVWTLIPRVDLGRSGGQNTGTIGFEEHNLAGTGIALSLLHDSEIDRSTDSVVLEDRELGGTRYRLLTAYNDSDDGNGYKFELGLPFYALDSRHSHGLALQQEDRIDNLYDRGDEQAEFRHDETRYTLDAGFSRGLRNGWVTRYRAGFALEEDRFAPVAGSTLPVSVLPEDRKFVYPFFGVEIIEDDFAVLVNHDQIGRVEDIRFGTRMGLQLGLAGSALGSLDDALLLTGSASKGYGEPGINSLFTSADLALRWQDNAAQNLMLHTAADWYYRQSPRRMLYTGVQANIGSNLDLDNPLYLGGDSGLRGYPLRYQGGDRSVLVTLEERYFTRLYPFRLFRIGGAVFFDAGRTWGDNPAGSENLGWLKDVGFGLRIGNNRTGTGKVIHIDLAFPLDGESSIDSMQFLVEAKATF